MQNKTTSHFQGAYVDDVVNVLNASILAQAHAVVVSPPGWGKTDIFIAAAGRIVGYDAFASVPDMPEFTGNRWNFTPLTPSSPPSLIEGMLDPRKYLQGEYVRMVNNTAMDPRNRIVILDEIGRVNEVASDSLIHAMERKDIPQELRPTIWGTTNFVMTDERSEAVRDRISLWLHINPSIQNVDALLDAMRARQKLTLAQTLPTWEEIATVRSWTAGDAAHLALQKFIGQILVEVTQGNDPVKLNNRRIRQWYDTLFSHAAWLTGTPDFAEIPGATKSLVRYLWPMPTLEAWEKWGRKTAGVADFVGSLIKSILAHTVTECEKIQSNRDEDPGKIALACAHIITTSQTEVKSKCGDDPRTKKALADLQNMAVAAVQGKKLSEQFKF